MPATDAVIVNADLLRQFVCNVFRTAGISVDEAEAIAGSLVDANLCGHESHGLIRVAEYLDLLRTGAVKPGVELAVLHRTAAMVACDGQLGFGQVQMRRLIDLLAPMAREHAVACGTIRNCGHVGRLGEWVERLADRGLASLLTVNDNGVLKTVAPPGGKEPRISTNPIALGAPGRDEPLVLDISTSMVANGKIRVAHIAGQMCPDGWLIDSSGRPTRDPATRFTNPPGTILPMGGYKGFGLGLLLDILVGGLSGGFCPPAPPAVLECNNVLLIAFDPARFSGVEHFLTQHQGLCDFLRSCAPIIPGDTIRLPNDRCRQTRVARLAAGIPVDRGTWTQLREQADRLGVTPPAAEN